MFIIRFFRWLFGWRKPCLLRLIPKVYYHEDDKSFEWVAFKPNKNDVDGLSFYRACKVTPAQLDASRDEKSGTYFVASIPVRELTSRGLTIVEIEGDLPGHVAIPEMSWQQAGYYGYRL